VASITWPMPAGRLLGTLLSGALWFMVVRATGLLLVLGSLVGLSLVESSLRLPVA